MQRLTTTKRKGYKRPELGQRIPGTCGCGGPRTGNLFLNNMEIKDIELEIKFRLTTAKNKLKERGGGAEKKYKAIGKIEVLELLLEVIDYGTKTKS